MPELATGGKETCLSSDMEQAVHKKKRFDGKGCITNPENGGKCVMEYMRMKII